MPVDKKALKRSFWGSLSRVVGVGLAAGSGSLLHQFIGDSLTAVSFAVIMAVASFVFIWLAEYERERN
jgi:uncharacterized membrane protein YgaE (UPF0421/DUF939 family)